MNMNNVALNETNNFVSSMNNQDNNNLAFKYQPYDFNLLTK